MCTMHVYMYEQYVQYVYTLCIYVYYLLPLPSLLLALSSMSCSNNADISPTCVFVEGSLCPFHLWSLGSQSGSGPTIH